MRQQLAEIGALLLGEAGGHHATLSRSDAPFALGSAKETLEHVGRVDTEFVHRIAALEDEDGRQM